MSFSEGAGREGGGGRRMMRILRLMHRVLQCLLSRFNAIKLVLKQIGSLMKKTKNKQTNNNNKKSALLSLGMVCTLFTTAANRIYV